ncbi:MAG: anaerobic ribonucleoside-triphosphate reductase activating protein [Deltaproteobacteria bacterium CG_4_8_14_3_um_filter_45_9]|jgi:pyruvate formate lyase activating enzyme|nr:MAG: anaerobic ribonucleoside-triphosphate reductase activating protein [Deltaproteobacteria bacterium CG03_land_8_20_14_0_80_45_14]PIX22207.1 MAG: anaerobic ribonucleoside-triphosphate reductase activating protein [Deltaproteobacteria bacterium CG_4_8_14_3_um_filter_45_9]
MIEIKGFLETSFLDWPGKLCSVFFLPYCNFRCPYCHNHPLVFNPEQYVTIPLEDILTRLHSLRNWIDGVCLTGGEPTLHADLPLLIREIKRHRFLVKLDTNGSNPQMLENLIETGEIDFVSMDVKAPLDPFRYSRSTGLPINLKPISESIEILKRGKVEYEFRMTVVPGLHREEDIQTLGDQLRVGRRFVLQNFNPENPLDPLLKNSVPYDLKVLKKIEKEVQEIL